MAKKKDIQAVMHRECRFSDLHQWPGDPLVVRCLKSGERWPASMGCLCALFKQRTDPEVVIHHTHDEPSYDWEIRND